MTAPYHVRLAVSQYGEQFRAELFTEDLGDTEGDLLPELPPSIAEWVPYLAQGADIPPDAARQLGKDLFAALLGQPENAKKWSEVLAQAARKEQPIRLLIDATTEAVRDLPYGLLCEPHDDWFLFRGNKYPVEFVRILRRCSPRPLKLRGRLRVLVAVAEPVSADVPPFDAPLRLQKLAAAIHKDVDLVVCGPSGTQALAEIAPDPGATDPGTFAPYTRTTRAALHQALTGDFDVFHLLAHGHGAGVLLCAPDGTPAETTAGELAEWCAEGRTALAFLQVCKAGQTAGRGGFGGVAQQLLNPRGGNLAAVIASTFPLDAEHSTDAAVGFYRRLAAGAPPEEALTCERPETDWCWAFLELWARPGALAGTQHRAAFQFVSPYRGLSSFGEQDADLFFGREAEVAELLQILRAEPALGVVGDSGSGKSSLLQAGLVDAIRHEGLAGTDKWRIASLRPGYRPAQALLAALTGATAEPTPDALRAALRAGADPLLIIFDQFEEVFTLARDKAEVQLLIEALAEEMDRRRDRFRLIIGMRSEFLGQAASVPGLSRLIRRPWVLRPPSEGDLREIVAGPAEHCGYTFQGPLADGNPAHAVGLLDRILADPLLARDQGAPLPLLQFALERMWLKAVEKGVTEFTHAEFDEIGGMGKAIAQHAEAVFQASATATDAGPAGRPLVEQIITALVSAQGTRLPRPRGTLQAETGQPDAARAVVDYLVGERLLTIRTDPEDVSRSLVDLSHEALIHNWDRLQGWLAEDPQGRAMREEFRTAAEKWEAGFAGAAPRSRFALPGADVARNYLAWIDANNPRLSPAQQEFAQAMRDMLTRQRRRRRLVMGALAALALASSALAVYADAQADKARISANEANKSAEDARNSAEAARASEQVAKDKEALATREQRVARERAAALALEKGIRTCEQGRPRLGIISIATALQLCPPEARDLRRVILTNLASWGPHLMCLDEVHDLRHPILATDDAGQYALVVLREQEGGLVNKICLFDIDAEKPVGPAIATLWRDEAGKSRLAYQVARATVLPNGVALLTGAGFSSVWNMKVGKQIGKEFFHGSLIAALSPDGTLVAAADKDDTVHLFDVETGAARKITYPHPGKVHALSFSTDSKLLATGCGRRTGAKSDLQDEQLPPGAPPPEGYVRLYDIRPKGTPGPNPRWGKWMANVVTCVKISPDNQFVTGGGLTLRSWRAADGTPEDVRPRHSPESTVHIAYDPMDYTEYIACNPSGGLQILRRPDKRLPVDGPEDPNEVAQSGERLSPQGWVAGTGFRFDGRVFTANGDGTVRIWRRPRGGDWLAHNREFHPPKAEAILSLAFRPDGKAFALGAKTGIVFYYELGNPVPKEFRCAADPKFGIRRPVTNLRFSTDGNRIMAHDEDLNTFVFDRTGGSNPLPAPGKLIGMAADGRTAVVQVQKEVPGPTGTHEVHGEAAVIQPRKVEYQIAEVGSSDFPATPKMVIPGGVADPRDEAGDGQLLRISRAGFSPDRSVVALLDWSGAVHLFRTATGEPVCAPIRHGVGKEADAIHALAFSPAGEVFLTRGPNRRGTWNARTGAPIHLHHHPIGIQVVRFSPRGRFVLAGTNFNMAQVWEASGREVTPVPLVHAARVWGVAANPNETCVLTASDDRTARIWDLATGAPISPPLLHKQGVSDALFSPDGQFALTGSWDGTARLWRVAEPLPDDEKWLTMWIETKTGLKIDPNVTGRLLTAEEWLKSKQELDRLGGQPPDTTSP